MWTRKELKEKAKVAFKANYWNCVLAALILCALIGCGVTVAGSLGSTASAPAQVSVASQNEIVITDGILDINGEKFDLKTIDGEDIKSASAAVSKGLDEGKLVINGETIDVSNQEKVAKVQESLQKILNSNIDQASHDDLMKAILAVVAIVCGVLLVFLIIAAIIKILVFNPLVVGCEAFFVANTHEKAKLGELKKGFSPRWMHNVGTMLLTDIYTVLWTLLFIIPGIVKSYSYTMVPFILADQPNMSANEAITLSRKMMKGNKWKTFVLDLSFIGWQILALLTFEIVGVFYVNPYVFATYAELYNTLKANTAK